MEQTQLPDEQLDCLADCIGHLVQLARKNKDVGSESVDLQPNGDCNSLRNFAEKE